MLESSGAGPSGCPLHRQQKQHLCLSLFETARERKRVGGSVGVRRCGWGAALFGPSFSPLALLPGVSVQVLLITSHWSGNPADLTGSNCCPGLSALSTPLPQRPPPHPSSLCSIPPPRKALKCMTAKWAPRRRDAGRIGGPGSRGIRSGSAQAERPGSVSGQPPSSPFPSYLVRTDEQGTLGPG